MTSRSEAGLASTATIGPIAWRLLGRTLLVPSLESAMLLRAILPAGYRFITPTCELLESDGRIIAGPLEAGAAGNAGAGG